MKVTDLDTPAVLIDVDVMERNLCRLASYCAEHKLKLRPHTKTHKIPELAKMQVEHGAAGITVAKLGEAEVMADAGLDDILIAYPILGEQKRQRLVSLARRVNVTVALDSVEVAREISDDAVVNEVTIGVRGEFDTGMGRCGMPIEESSIAAVREIHDLPGLEWRGIQLYPGHIMATARERLGLIEQENQKLARLWDLLRSAGIDYPDVSGGNTPAAYLSHHFIGVTEIRPGTYIFNDKNTVCSEAATYEDCAVTVLARVVSRSVRGKAIIDAGSKTLSGDLLLTGDRRGYGHMLGYPDVYIADLSEEHGHVNLHGSAREPRLGELVRVVPNHVCPCVNMHDRAFGVQGEHVVCEWRIAGRGKVQ
ncbi:MAG TPA: alanine racemase [Bryobacteraceae bacterium]|nr:alanine racemase [Bryobacteraceae bacterium]